MYYIKITDVVFDPVPSGDQICTIRHRKASDPDVFGSYTIDSTSFVVKADGSFNPFFYILNLENVPYVVEVSPNCGGFKRSLLLNASAPTTTAAGMGLRFYSPGLRASDRVVMRINNGSPARVIEGTTAVDIEFVGPVPVAVVSFSNQGSSNDWFYEIRRRSNNLLLYTGEGQTTDINVYMNESSPIQIGVFKAT